MVKKKTKLLIGVTIATPLLIIVGYLFALWVAYDFNPDFLKSDSCLDLGGRWNYEENRCEK